MTKMAYTCTVNTFLWLWFWTTLDQTGIVKSTQSSSQHNSTGSINTLHCPSACDNDPCHCVVSQVGKCMMETCVHMNNSGCNQCYPGYFKKDYNYPCVGCNDTFGSDCLVCTDFLGCAQCFHGVRTYDRQCGLFFCSIKIESSTDTGFDSLTPAPTRSPTDDDTEHPLTTEEEEGCINYFQVDSVSDDGYNFLKDTYFPVKQDDQEFKSSNGSVVARISVINLDNSSTSRASLIFKKKDDDVIIYLMDIYVSTTDETILSPFVGSHTFDINDNNTSSSSINLSLQVTLNIRAYTCEFALILPRCCIFINGMTVDQQTQLGQYLSSEMELYGGNSAFNGEYCDGYDVNNSDTFIQISKQHDSNSEHNHYYAAVFLINENSFVEFRLIATEIVNNTEDTLQYKATYSVAVSEALACNIDTERINHFFQYTNGTWNYSSHYNKDINKINVTLKPSFDLSHCIKRELWCQEVILNNLESNPLIMGITQIVIVFFTFDVCVCFCICNSLADRFYSIFLHWSMKAVALAIILILYIIFSL